MQTAVCIAVSVLALICAPRAAAATVTLGWGTVNSDLVAGYNIYYGTNSGQYPFRTSVNGNVGSTQIPGLLEGGTYYFAVAAFTADGYEGDLSDEAVYTVPVVPRVSLDFQTIGPKKFLLATSGTVPAHWTIEASEDMLDWHTIAAGTNSTARVAILIADAAQMSFRLKSSTPGVRLKQTALPDASPGSFFITTEGAAPPQWTLESTTDMRRWTTFTSGTKSPLNAAVIVSTAPKMFFRLKGQ